MHRQGRSAVGVGLAAAALAAPLAHAQIATDGTLGTATALSGPNFAIPASLGRQAGANLFHSFAAFGVPTGGSATFSGPTNVANVISRVTGASASSIDGTLRSTIAGANLFLINPRGIVFGPNASLDLTGAFYASTANYLRMGDGTRFEATATVPAVLSMAPPEAFGFLGPTAAPITLAQGAQLAPPPGVAVSLVGGPISMTGALVYTTSADARVVAAQGAGEVSLAGIPGAGLAGAAISVSGGGVVAESLQAAAPGRIVIRGGALTLTDASVVSNNSSASAAPPVEMLADGDMRFSGGQLLSIAQGTGRGADIVARGENVRIDTAAWVQSTTLGAGRAGDVDLSARSRLSVIELASDPDRTVVAAQTEADGDGGDLRLAGDVVQIDGAYLRNRTFGGGNSGVLAIDGRNVDVVNGASVAVETKAGSVGSSGGLDVRAAGRVRIAGTNAFGEPAYVFSATEGAGAGGDVSIRATELAVLGGYLDTVTAGSGNGGALVIDADTVRVETFGPYVGSITSLSDAGATGRAGSITIRAADSVTVSGSGENWLGGGFGPSLVATQNVGPGEGGTIVVEAPRIALDQGAIVAEGYASGRVGSIALRTQELTMLRDAQVRSTRAPGASGASGAIRIEGGGVLTLGSRTATTVAPAPEEGGTAVIFTTDEAASPSGSISIDMQEVFVGPSSAIATIARGTGDAGDIFVRAGRMTVRAGLILSQTGAGVPTDAPGRAGAISLDIAEAFDMSNLGEVPAFNAGVLSSASTGRGAAGDIRISASSVTLDSVAVQAATAGAGRGGRIEILANALTLRNGAQVSTGTEPGSTGEAGAIDVQVAGRLDLYGQRSDGISSGFTATTRGSGRGGDVSIAADTITMRDGALVSASTNASGDAGSVGVSGRVLDLFDGRITTTSAGVGNAGPILIAMRERAAIAGRVSSETEGRGRGGTVSVTAPEIAVSGSVVSRTEGGGDAGSVAVSGGRITIEGSIDSSTVGSGAAGDIAVIAAERLEVSGSIVAETAGLGGGRGGHITLQAPLVDISGIWITTRTGSGGDAGGIDIAGDEILLRDFTTVTSSVVYGTGRGGDVRITGARLVRLADWASVSSSTGGDGRGGDILITAPLVVVGGDAVIITGSEGFFGEGNGDSGGITIAADRIVLNGSIDASTQTRGRAGSIVLRGGELDMRSDPDAFGVASIASETTGEGPAGSILLDMSRGMQIAGIVSTETFGAGPGGDVTLRAPSIVIAPGGSVSAESYDSGAAGRIAIEGGAVRIDGGRIESAAFADGAAGSATLRGTRIEVVNGGRIDVSTEAGGRGGQIDVQASEAILVSGANASRSSSVLSSTAGTGDAGGILLDAPVVAILDGGRVSASSEPGAAGVAGGVRIRAGAFTLGGASAARVESSTAGAGAGGNVSIGADAIVIDANGLVAATGAGAGAAGAVELAAAGALAIDGGSVLTSAFDEGRGGDVLLRGADIALTGGASVLAQSLGGGDAGRVTLLGGSVRLDDAQAASSATGAGAAGSVRVDGARVELVRGGRLDASTAGSGAGGRIEVTASGSIGISGSGAAPGAVTGMLSRTSGSRDAGDVSLAAPQIAIVDGGVVSASSESTASGAAGSVHIRAGSFLLAGPAESRVESSTAGAGAGGDVSIAAADLRIGVGGVVAASSAGSGAAGSVQLVAADELRLFGGRVLTEAAVSDGGNIDVRAGRLIHLRAGEISTSVAGGAGAGGNIFIDPTFVILEDGSRIVANAFGGPGGNITLIADYFFASLDSLVQASSALGVPGTVTIATPQNNVNAALAKLPGAVLDVSALLRDHCAPRAAGAAAGSSLVDVGRGGLALSPERLSASRYFGVEALRSAGPGGATAPRMTSAPRARIGACSG